MEDYISISPTITDPALLRMQEQPMSLPVATQSSGQNGSTGASSYVQVAQKPQDGLLTTIGRIMVANKIAILLIVAALVAVIIAYFVFSKPTNSDADGAVSSRDLENGNGTGPPQPVISAPPPRKQTPEALANLQKLLDEDPNGADATQKESNNEEVKTPVEPMTPVASSIDLSWSANGPSVTDMQAAQEVPVPQEAHIETPEEAVSVPIEEKPKRGKQSAKKSA